MFTFLFLILACAGSFVAGVVFHTVAVKLYGTVDTEITAAIKAVENRVSTLEGTTAVHTAIVTKAPVVVPAPVAGLAAVAATPVTPSPAAIAATAVSVEHTAAIKTHVAAMTAHTAALTKAVPVTK